MEKRKRKDFIRFKENRCALVVEHDVGKPYVLAGYVEFGDTSVLCRIPLKLVILPFLQFVSND